LITQADIARIDRGNMMAIYEQWPKHFREAQKIPVKPEREADSYNSLVLCGMGGSGTSCDILCDLMSLYSNTPTVVLKGQSLPATVNRRSLVVVNSVSGNTAESLITAQAASERKADVICISSGGKLKEWAASNGCIHVSIPNLSVPRASLPYLVMPGLKIIEPFLAKSVEEEIGLVNKNIAKTSRSVSSNIPEEDNAAKKIANFLQTGFAFCFTSPYLVSVGTRFKDSLNENAKVHCLRESVLEASHNEIVPFTFDNGFDPKVLFLRWAGDSDLSNERFANVKSLFEEIDQPSIELVAYEKSLLSAILCSIYILDYVTIYMAISRKIDPSPTPAIDILKRTSK
jgi:glucose/mannose-6-phosphate isomerase